MPSLNNRKYTILTNDMSIMEYFLDYLNKKKLLLYIFDINDKTAPFYCIIKIRLGEKSLVNLIKKKFNNKLVLRK